MKIKFSILICSLESRRDQLNQLVAELENQIGDKKGFEILVDIDNKERSTGNKRQNLLEQAQGKYVVFIDDDDWIFDCYISQLLDAYPSKADCFAINGIYTENGEKKTHWRISKDFDNTEINDGKGGVIFLRTTNHITPVKRELALKAGFPDKSNAEDKYYSVNLNPHLKTEHVIEPHMYHYRFSTYNKEYK